MTEGELRLLRAARDLKAAFDADPDAVVTCMLNGWVTSSNLSITNGGADELRRYEEHHGPQA